MTDDRHVTDSGRSRGARSGRPEESRWRQRLANRGLVLDGGLATRLEQHGCDLAGPLWSARILAEAPEMVARVQREYRDAGAECITTATYQATVEGLRDHGLSRSRAEATLAGAVGSTRRAVGDAVWVASSVGPYGAALADGSEYRGDYGVAPSVLRAFHRDRLSLLLEGEPDLLAIETIPCRDEILVLLELLCQLDRPGEGWGAWLSVSVRNAEELADGTPLLGHWLVEAEQCSRVWAIGVNCLAPELVAPTLELLGSATSLPLVAYPNSGERWVDGEWAPQEAAPDGKRERHLGWPSLVERWWARRARLIGGCCRTGPADIAAIAAKVGELRRR